MTEEELLKEAVREGLLAIWREESEEHERKVGQYYPSGIGSCLRKQYYEYTIPRPPSPEALAIFATGKGIHEAVADALSKSGRLKVEVVELPVSLRISDEIELSGRVDLLLAEISGKRAVVEVKSSSRLPSEPHENHLLQLQTYLHALRIELGLLLYWDKRTGEISCFNVQRDQAWLAKLGERVILLHQNLLSSKPPFREAMLLGRYWECDQCPYQTECDPFSLNGVPAGAALALVGVSPKADGARRRLDDSALQQVKDIAFRRKALGDIVVVLSDGHESKSDLSELLRSSGVNYDVILSRPQSFRSGSFWMLELAKRLATKYRISFYSDMMESASDPGQSHPEKDRNPWQAGG